MLRFLFDCELNSTEHSKMDSVIGCYAALMYAVR